MFIYVVLAVVLQDLHCRGYDVNLLGVADLAATATQAEHEVERRLLLNVVVRKRTTILELLARKDETLLIRWNALLVLDLLLHVLDRVAGLHVERDGLARKRLNEDLHAAAQAEHEVERRLLLNVVVSERTTILKLLARKDETLLIRGDALL